MNAMVQQLQSEVRTALWDAFGLQFEAHLGVLRSAQNLAMEAHDGQTRQGGEDYVLHPLRVSWAVAKWAASQRLVLETAIAAVIAATLHDAVEDTDVTLEAIRQQFGPEVARLVQAVSHPNGNDDEPDEVYFKRIQDGGLMAIAIKLFDVMDNIDSLWQADVNFRRQKIADHRQRQPLWRAVDPALANLITAALDRVPLD